MEKNIRVFRGWSLFCIFASLAVFVWLIAASRASGEVNASIDLKGAYEDNITGSAADVGKGGDFYSVLNASLGGYYGIGANTYLFLKGDAGGYLYSKYTDLNAIVVGINGGVYKDFTARVAAQLMLKGKRKEFKDSRRDSVAYGGSIEVKEQISPRFWLKQAYEFEENDADNALFTYRGHSLGAWAGYMVFPKTTLTGGYSFLSLEYDEPSNFRNEFHTVSVGISREVIKKVSLYGNYYRQFINSSASEKGRANNIFFIGLLYSY